MHYITVSRIAQQYADLLEMDSEESVCAFSCRYANVLEDIRNLITKDVRAIYKKYGISDDAEMRAHEAILNRCGPFKRNI